MAWTTLLFVKKVRPENVTDNRESLREGPGRTKKAEDDLSKTTTTER
jgi:hypothetical protein